MFKVAENPTFSATVTVEIRGDGGAVTKQAFDAVFKRPTQKQLDDIAEQMGGGSLNDEGLINEWMTGWRGVVDDNGDIPFTPENRDRVMNIFPVRPSTVKAFFAGLSTGRAKN